MLSWFKHEKRFITSGPETLDRKNDKLDWEPTDFQLDIVLTICGSII